MKINKLIAIIILVLLVAMTGCWSLFSARKSTTTIGSVDVPIGDDMATQIKNGTTIYTTGDVPAFVLNGTDAVTTDFLATVKVLDVLNTITIRVEILSPTTLEQQQGNMGYLYLCQPLSNKAEKLSDGTIAYGGDGYPQIIEGQSYDVAGVIQPQWQDYPYAYIPGPPEFKQTPAETSLYSTGIQMFITAARSFAEQAEEAGGHHLTAEPVVTVSSKQIQAGKMEVIMGIKAMDVLTSGPRDSEPVIAGKLQYLQDHGAALSAAARKAVEDDIAYWRSTIYSAMNVPTETSYPIRIVADVDVAGNIDASSLQVYIDNGAARGSHFIPAAQFFKDIRSARVTVAQSYADAESVAIQVSANAPPPP